TRSTEASGPRTSSGARPATQLRGQDVCVVREKRSNAPDAAHRSRQCSTRRAVGKCRTVSMVVLSVVIVSPSAWFGGLVAGRFCRLLGVPMAGVGVRVRRTHPSAGHEGSRM